MNLFQIQNILSINEYFMDDEQQRTEFTINYMSWDANGVPMETTEIVRLTKTAQDDILDGLKKIRMALSRET